MIRIYPIDTYAERVKKTLASHGHNLDISDNLLTELDSLDWVELVMLMEEEFNKEIPDEIAMSIWESGPVLTYTRLAFHIKEYIEHGTISEYNPDCSEVSFNEEHSPVNNHAPDKETNLFNLLDNLSNLQSAIDRADNKQSKRIQDRDRAVTKINKMLPKGWSLVNNTPTFDPNEIEEGSVWECTSNIQPCFSDCTPGGHYVIHCASNRDKYYFNDDKGYTVVRGKNPIIDSFRRVK